MNYLILIRHGQSKWNLEKRFTGWADIQLTEKGKLVAIDNSDEFLSLAQKYWKLAEMRRFKCSN